MPKVFDWNGYRFHFYANEGDPREPAHIHIARPGAEAKFWLSPEVELAYNRGLDARTIRRLHDVVVERRSELMEAWNEFFA